MARAKTKAPPLFGVTEVNDIYCDISRNIPRSEWLGITLPFTMVLVSLTALFILTPLIGYLQELIFLVPILLLLLYSGIHAVRLFIIKPKSLMVRLNRQEQKIYVQKHCINYNIFSQWPVETLVFNWHEVIHPSFRNGSGSASSRTWYTWHISPPASPRVKVVISDDNIPLFYNASRYSINLEDTILNYAISWQWCNDYMRGINSPVYILPTHRYSFKYCVTTLSNRMLSRADESDRWTTIFPICNPLFWVISFFIVPLILADALALYWIMRRLPDTVWSDSAQAESTSES